MYFDCFLDTVSKVVAIVVVVVIDVLVVVMGIVEVAGAAWSLFTALLTGGFGSAPLTHPATR